jgi:L-ascorbate metabolism protein UlaG (beta-lactamase superfamily)
MAVRWLGLVGLSLVLSVRPVNAAPQDRIQAAGGDITITLLGHASVRIVHAGKVIYIDPVGDTVSAALVTADLILITDLHPDHLDPAAIARLRKPTTRIVAPAAAAASLDNAIVFANGDTRSVDGIVIEAVPAYNLTRGPAPGQLYHEKGRGNGYVLALGGRRIYIAGDTEGVPEMRALKNIDVAFIPMNLPYTMPPSEAAEAVKAFRPGIVYPYHYRGSDPKEFEDALRGTGVDVRVVDIYPTAVATGAAAGSDLGLDEMRYLAAGLAILSSDGTGLGPTASAFQGLKPFLGNRGLFGVVSDLGINRIDGETIPTIMAGLQIRPGPATDPPIAPYVQILVAILRRDGSPDVTPALGGGADVRLKNCYRARFEVQLLPGDRNIVRFVIGVAVPVRRN